MYALYEDAGKFHAGRVMTEADSSMQIELDSGKRVKVKSANVLLKFDKPLPAELFASAQTIARDIDLDLAWEFAPEQEFGFAAVARGYSEASAGIDALVVPYNGTPAVHTALLAGQVDVGFEVLSPMLPHIAAGPKGLRALAVTSDRRYAGLPHVPTVQEAGVPKYSVASWNALAAPAGTPPLVIEALNAASTTGGAKQLDTASSGTPLVVSAGTTTLAMK